MPKALKVIIIIGLLLGLVLVRAFEYDLFYDPLLKYFKGNHLTEPLPEINIFKLVFSYTLRYGINAMISLLILKIVFPKNSFLNTIVLFYTLAFVLLMLLFFSFIVFEVNVGNLILFYIRRFIIQPIFILLLFPLLYLFKKGYTL
ncbi:exosortase F system-associated membrane protein [Wenyingzhuangia sp. IMCC45533]